MMRVVLAPIALLALCGCDILFPEDPRLGSESVAACAARVQQDLRIQLADLGSDDATVWVPTYTYDITKLSLEAIQELSQSSSDETQGTRLDQATNETSTAVDVFMAQDVDENGAFFLGRNPALYRVRGEAARFDDILPAGCERQQANMRLIVVDFAPAASNLDEPSDSSETSPETESD